MKETTHITTGPSGVFEIRDPAIELQTLVKEIESNLAAHKMLFAGSPPMHRFAPGAGSSGDGSASNLPDLLFHLRRFEESLDQVGAERELAPSWATQLPLVGRWWNRIRCEVHNLILFYVNRAAARQTGLNDHTVVLLRCIPGQAEEIELLKTRVALLEDRLGALEAGE